MPGGRISTTRIWSTANCPLRSFYRGGEGRGGEGSGGEGRGGEGRGGEESKA